MDLGSTVPVETTADQKEEPDLHETEKKAKGRSKATKKTSEDQSESRDPDLAGVRASASGLLANPQMHQFFCNGSARKVDATTQPSWSPRAEGPKPFR